MNENILAVKSNHGGYHFYEKVLIKKGQFSDFFILKINNSSPGNKATTFKELKHYLTGFVREVRYKDNGCIISIQEGFMEKGFLSGFGRIVTVSPQNRLEIKTGFWKSDNGILMPHGKFVWHSVSERGYRTILPFGVYTG